LSEAHLGRRDPVLHLVVGPNGSGKTTLVTEVLAPVTHLPFVNADVIAAERWPDAPAEHAYDASAAAARERERLISARTSFITETVFSHPSKLELIELAEHAGYRVELHVVMLPEQTTVERVRYRVRHGGHRVPVTKIRQRYRRLWPLVARARDLADATYVYDNSLAATPFRLVAEYENGLPIGVPALPVWAPTAMSTSR
jgi:predicted ABC-type ATPase